MIDSIYHSHNMYSYLFVMHRYILRESVSPRIGAHHSNSGPKEPRNSVHLPLYEFLFQTLQPAKAHQVRDQTGAIETRSRRPARVAITRKSTLQPCSYVHDR